MCPWYDDSTSPLWCVWGLLMSGADVTDKTCPECGQPIKPGASTCDNCGTSIAPVAGPPAETRSASPRVKRFALWGCGFGLLICLLLCNSLIFIDIALVSPVALLLSSIAAIFPAAFYSGIVLLLDRYEREPGWVLMGSFLWGALVATIFSFVLNTLFSIGVELTWGIMVADILSAAISAPIVEEASKGAVLFLLFIFLRHEFDNVLDGIVYGSLVGIGFAMTENILYFGYSFLEGSLVGLGLTVYLRAILGGLGHAAYTATTGAGLGLAAQSNSLPVKIFAPLIGLGLAMFQHFAWNFFAATIIPAVVLGANPSGGEILAFLFIGMPLIVILFTGPPVVTLVIMSAFVWRREAAIIREQLRGEVATGVLTAQEYDNLTSTRKRLSAERRALMNRGVRAWRRQVKFHHTAAELAFRKWHRSRNEPPKRAQKRVSEDEYRRRLRALRGDTPVPAAPVGAAPSES